MTRARHWVTLGLLILLLVLQAQLWIGRGSLGHVSQLRQQLAQQQSENLQAAQTNAQLVLDVNDLKDGLTIIEEKARSELGMIKPGEIYVRLSP